MDESWKSYIIPPIFVAGLVFGRDVFLHFMPPESPQVWIDVALNVGSYTISKLVVEKLIDANFSGFIENGINIAVEPALHGLMTGLVSYFGIDNNTLISLPRRGNIRTNNGFMNGFLSGAQYNILGSYLSQPLVQLV